MTRKGKMKKTGGGTGRKGSEHGWKRWNRGEHIDGSSDDFLHTHRHKWSPTHPPLPYGPGPAGNTHTLLTSHTPWLGPPIKSKVVCFYWSFALTSGLSFWRLYLSVSSWKSFVDNAQCFQLGENQTPGALAIFPPPKAHLPSSLFSSTLLDSLPFSSFPFHSPPSSRRMGSVSSANYRHKTKVVAVLVLGAAGPGSCQH